MDELAELIHCGIGDPVLARPLGEHEAYADGANRVFGRNGGYSVIMKPSAGIVLWRRGLTINQDCLRAVVRNSHRLLFSGAHVGIILFFRVRPHLRERVLFQALIKPILAFAVDDLQARVIASRCVGVRIFRGCKKLHTLDFHEAAVGEVAAGDTESRICVDSRRVQGCTHPLIPT